MAITYYYPEGPLGPTCDIFTDDDDDGRRRRRLEDLGDGREATYGPVDWGDLERVMDGPVNAIRSRRCRIRTLADGTQEYYDCVDDFLTPIGEPSGYPLVEPQYDWKRISTTPWGLDDNFEPARLTPIDCSPFDPDINIIPVKFYKANGTFVEKVLRERSSPPTFPVSDGTVSTLINESVTARFVEEGGFDANGFSVYNELDGNSDFDDDGFIPSSLNEWHYMNDGGNAKLWNNIGETVEDNYTMTGGSGSGMVLRIELEGTAGSAGNPSNTRLRVKQVISAGTGYQSGDNVNFNFTTPRRTNEGLGPYNLNPTPIRLTSVGSGALKLRVPGGPVNGQIGIKLKWNDNPNTAGTALGTVSIAGRTFTQSGRKGKQSATIDVTPGTDYPVTITGGTGYGGKEVLGDRVGFYDLDGTDFNATLIIEGGEPAESEPGPGAWNDDADQYAVWVNPEVCTLPCQTQTVTYLIDIPATDTYTITGGADDSFKVFLNDSTTPIIDAGAGIFSEEHERRHTGRYTPPHSSTQTLQAGTLKMVVQCTNSAAGFGSCDGAGSTYSTVPLYRYLNSTTGDHFTGTDVTPPSGYANEGILCHLFTYPFPGAFQVVDYEPGKPQSSYTLYGFSPHKYQPFSIGDEPVTTALVYAKSNGNDVMWTTDATEGNSDTPAYALDTTNHPQGNAFYAPSSPTTITLGEGMAPFGNAFVWQLNPGGWYIKICRGTSCIGGSTINWVRSGPDPKERWGSFMDSYAVYPSNSDVLIDTDHTATYNVLIPFAGNYTFEYASDNQGTFTFDGTQIATSTNFTSSNTVTLSNVTAGPHTVGVTIRNAGPNTDWTENPAGIAWTLTPDSGGEGLGTQSIDWTITGQSSDAGYRIRNNGRRIQWDDNISNGFDVNATMDIGKVTQLMGSNIGVSFSSDGTGLDVTGSGEAEVRLDFEWDDNPSQSGLAVGSLTIAGETFTQTDNTESETFPITIAANDDKGRGPTAAVVQVKDKEIDFTDATYQMDTDAEFKIVSTSPGVSANFTGSNDSNLALVTTGIGTVTLKLEWDDDPSRNGKAVGELYIAGQTIDQSGDEGEETITINVSSGQSSQSRIIKLSRYGPTADVVASSLDLKPVSKGGNLIWHTRKAVGYEYVEI